jgi:hypothetical protein
MHESVTHLLNALHDEYIPIVEGIEKITHVKKDAIHI